MKKKLLALLMAGALSFTNLYYMPSQIVEASAISINEGLTYGDYKYIVLDDNTVEIKSYLGKDSNIEIPQSINNYKVSKIGDSAFKGNEKLESVIIPDGITQLGDYAFDCVVNLKEVTVGKDVKYIGKSAFFSCARLESVQFSEGLESIGDGAFYDCESLNDIFIPSGVKNIGEYTFGKCKSLCTVVIGEGVEDIKPQTFINCENLQGVKLPESLKKIDRKAFMNCNQLSDINIPQSVDYIGEKAFYFCSSIQKLSINANIIDKNAFELCSSLVELELSDNVKELGDNAFNGIKAETIIIPKNLQKIGIGALSGFNCSSIKVDEENSYFVTIDNALYSKDKKILIQYVKDENQEKFVIPEGVEIIESNAFFQGYDLTEVVIPDLVKSINDSAFAFCSSLQSIKIPKATEYIGKNAFNGCSQLNDLKIFSENLVIDDYAFYRCGLSNFVFQNGIKKINKYAFSQTQINNVILQSDVKEVSALAFHNCNIINIEVSEDNQDLTSVEGVLYSKDKTKLIMYPPGRNAEEYTVIDGTEVIGTNAFIPSFNLRKINLPEGLKTISEGAFKGCTFLNSITIPDTVTSIGKNSFGYDIVDSVDNIQQMDSKIIYGKNNTEAQKYADENDILFIEDEAKPNAEDIDLEVGQTFDFDVANVDKSKLVFTSSDENVVKVDNSGKIKAVGKGNTKVYASIATYNFVCNVNVTSVETSSISKAAQINLSDYKKLTKDNYEKWEETYYKNNKSVSFEPLDNPNIKCYSSNEYIAIMASKVGGSYISRTEKEFGKDVGQYDTIADNLNLELNRYNLNENLVLYSGKSNVDDIIGKKSTIANMKASVGKTFVNKGVISTSIDHLVATNFQSGAEGTVLEIYAPKSITKGAYIKNFSEFPTESELLLSEGNKFEIIDAGVREVNVEGYDGTKKTMSERFLKLRIVDDTKKEEEKEDPIIPSKEDKKEDKTTEDVNTKDNNNPLIYIVAGGLCIGLILKKRSVDNE